MLRCIALAICLFSTSAAAQEFERVPSQLLIEEMGRPLGISSSDVKVMPSLAIEIVKHFEQWVPHAYNDPIGYCTIGYGHLIDRKRCEDIQLGPFASDLSESQGLALLDSDTVGARAAVQDLVEAPLTDEQFGALSSFVFNVGRTRFANSTLLRLVNEGDYDQAAPEFRRWVKAGGRVFQGLVARRACEEALFVGRLHYDQHGRFSRAACVTLGAAPEVGDLIDIERGEN